MKYNDVQIEFKFNNLGGTMEEYMYTYQYYKRRALPRPKHSPNFLMPTVILFGALYTATSLFYLFN